MEMFRPAVGEDNRWAVSVAGVTSSIDRQRIRIRDEVGERSGGGGRHLRL